MLKRIWSVIIHRYHVEDSMRFVSCVVSIATSRLKKGYRRTSSASFFRFFFFRTLYLYISEGMYFGPMEVAATTRWRRAFNLELMNESSRDWTAMSWAISGTSPWRMMHLDVCFHLVILSILFLFSECLLIFRICKVFHNCLHNRKIVINFYQCLLY